MNKQYDDPIILAQRQYRAVKATKPTIALWAALDLRIECTREQRSARKSSKAA